MSDVEKERESSEWKGDSNLPDMLPLPSATATVTAARFARQATEVASWQREFKLSVNLHLIELSLCVSVSVCIVFDSPLIIP